jgi:hypothetical protein
MSGQNWQFNPVTRDYVLSLGSFVPTDRSHEKAYFILTIPRTKWLYGTQSQGSDLYRFKNAKRTSNTEQLYASRVDDALKTQMVDTGDAVSSTTTNLESSRYGTSNNTNIVVPNRPRVPQLGFGSV